MNIIDFIYFRFVNSCVFFYDINIVFIYYSRLDCGILRTGFHYIGIFIVNFYSKKLIIMYMKFCSVVFLRFSSFVCYDIFFNKFIYKDCSYFSSLNIRFTFFSFVRYGACVCSNVILMPCFINVGSYIGSGTMIDSWSTVGSCAYIGDNVHISGGVGIGGVLEPINSTPVVIENNCFIGARSEIVEGVIVKSGSVISMGVFIGKSTRIYDRINCVFYNSFLPRNSVAVSGCLSYGFYSLYAVIIVKYKNVKTLSKIMLNPILRSLRDY